MGGPHIDALRISPRFTSIDWHALERHSPGDWAKAADMVKDRLDGRFLRYAGNCLRSPNSGFVVLAIDSLLLETLQQFREGVTNGHGKSQKMVTRFLEGRRFQPEFDQKARDAYYSDIRCGLLHQAEAKKMWLIRRGHKAMLQTSPDAQGYVIDVRIFHNAVRCSMNDYLRDLRLPTSNELRANLWTKMDYICNVRSQRGAVYATEMGQDPDEAYPS
jgi:hypothetical protein